MGKSAIPKTASARRASAEEAALGSALSHVERFLDTLGNRCDAARQGAEAAASGARPTARAQLELEETWADYDAARRLRDTIAAAVASAQAKVAIVEAEAVAAVLAAFKQFEKDRAWRRRATRRGGARGRSQKRAERPKSPHDLAEMVANAKMAVVHVVADNKRLVKQLVDTRTEAAELHALLAGDAADVPAEPASIRRRIELCEGHARYLEQQLLASATVTQQLVAGLRDLISGLPEPVARTFSELDSRRWSVWDEN